MLREVGCSMSIPLLPMNSFLVGVAELIKLKSLLCREGELSEILSNVRAIIPEVKIRVQRSYAWLMFVTLKVHQS